MKNPLREYVATLTDETCIQIMKDQEQFERDGFIGDCVLREKTKIFMMNSGVKSFGVMVMNQMVFEVYRRYAYEANQLLTS